MARLVVLCGVIRNEAYSSSIFDISYNASYDAIEANHLAKVLELQSLYLDPQP